MKYGSLRQLWAHEGSNKEEAKSISQAMKDARPGYFLLVAAKSCREER